MPSKPTEPIPILAIYGSENYRKREVLAEFLNQQINHTDSIGPTRHDGEKAELAQVLDDVRTMSLLGGRQVVIVDDADKFITRYRDKLEKYAAAPADSGTLILICNRFDARTKLHTAVKKVGRVIKCEALKPYEILRWINSRAREEYQKTIDQEAAKSLRDHVGDDMGLLDAELGKLATYVGAATNRITTEDINLLVGQLREQIIFDVLDAIADGNAAHALQCWEQVLATDRAAPGRAIGGMAWAARRLLEAKQILEKTGNIAAAAKHIYRDVNIAGDRLSRYSLHQLQDLLTDLLRIDFDAKTGLSNVPRSMESYVVKHTVAAR
jgi:DNA polymerase-3 subunit delta